MDFYALAHQCAPQVEPQVMAAVVHVESSFNPYAIGVVGGSIKQPRNYAEAVLAVRQLRANGNDFSVGLSQVNQSNFNRYGLDESNMFNPCSNLSAGAAILQQCYHKANSKYGIQHSYDGKLRMALSCYYSGNFSTGFTADFARQPPYVVKVYSKIIGYRNGSQSQPSPMFVPTVAPRHMTLSQDGKTVVVEAIQAQKHQQVIANSPQLSQQSSAISSPVLTAKVVKAWDAFGEFN